VKTLLITSVGSLVGQNLLDSLEGRRQNLRVLGSNSLAASPNNFRCDTAFLAPPVAEGPAWQDFHAALIEAEAVDLVIPGRDDDVLALAQLRAERPQMANRLMVGSVQAAWLLLDKGLCAQFAHAQGLPFAATVLGGTAEAVPQAEALWRQHGPLIAKPARGNGSRGVRLTLTREQVLAAASAPGWVLQPYLDPQPEWQALAEAWQLGLPLWSELPERSLYGAQFLIDPAGRVGEPFGYLATQTAGRPIEVAACDDPELLAAATGFAEALARLGWRGAGNVQAKRCHAGPDAGRLQVIEANGRFTGTTHARCLLGFDEVGQALAQWLGRPAPAPPSSAGAPGDRVIHEQWVAGSAVERLAAAGVWQRTGRHEGSALEAETMHRASFPRFD